MIYKQSKWSMTSVMVMLALIAVLVGNSWTSVNAQLDSEDQERCTHNEKHDDKDSDKDDGLGP